MHRWASNFLDRVEVLKAAKIIQSGVITVIVVSGMMLVEKAGWVPSAYYELIAVWSFNWMLCIDLGYAREDDPLGFVLSGVGSGLVSIVALVVIPILVTVKW